MAIGTPVAGSPAVNAGASTTLDVPWPTVAAGDVVVMLVATNSATLTALPSGWQAGFSTRGTGSQSPTLLVCLRVATGTESGTFSVTTPSTTSKGRMWAVSGVDTTTPQDATARTVSPSAATTLVIPTTTTVTPGALIFAAGTSAGPAGTWTPPTSPDPFTEIWEIADGTAPATNANYLIWSSSGATGTVTLTRSSSLRSVGGMIVLRPALTATPPGQSSGGGDWAFTSAGVGTSGRTSQGTGVWALASAGTGVTARRATGSGAFAFSGAGNGRTARRAAGAGTFAYVGAGTGTRPSLTARQSSGAGTFAYVGAGSGVRPVVGVRQSSGSGAWTHTGAGVGRTTRRGSTAGTFVFIGAGQGKSPRHSAGAGVLTFAGTGLGRTSRRGSGSAVFTFIGGGVGRTNRRGSGAGQWTTSGVGTVLDDRPTPLLSAQRLPRRFTAAQAQHTSPTSAATAPTSPLSSTPSPSRYSTGGTS